MNKRKILLGLTTILISLSTILMPTVTVLQNPPSNVEIAPPVKSANVLSNTISGSGKSNNATAYMIRPFLNQKLPILNTYANTSRHAYTLDLSTYQVPGWSLYMITMDVENITAAPERKIAGISPDANDFYIGPYPDSNPTDNHTQLAQSIKVALDSLLNNFSIKCYMNLYGETLDKYGEVYLTVREDYKNSSSSIMSPVSMPSIFVWSWYEVTVQSNIIGNQEYYVTMDGTSLVKYAGYFPIIYWKAEAQTKDSTYWYSANFAAWDPVSVANREALINYTYTPWNTSTDTPLTFRNPQNVGLAANKTPLTNPSQFKFTSSTNLTSIMFESNQSIYVFNNMTLWYKKNISSYSRWQVLESGGDVHWNTTATVLYPNIPSVSERILNFTVEYDWDAKNLTNTLSSLNHTAFEQYGRTVKCTAMTNETWTLSSVAHNYVASIETPTTLNILDNPTITTRIHDAFSNNAETGTTNLTIFRNSISIWSPANQSVSEGSTLYSWDIDETTSDKGIFSIEVYWSNGTEAGYKSLNVVVYHSTDLTSDFYNIEIMESATVALRIYFEDTFTSAGITTADGIVKYSFNGQANVTMIDHGNGTWTADISTTGLSAGSYLVRVYGEGFALENRTIDIYLRVVYATDPISPVWEGANGNNISYIQDTVLSVVYQFSNGTIIDDAIVNVTDGVNTWPLRWNATSGTYWIRFNGSSPTPGIGTFNLEVTAWRPLCQTRVNSSLTLLIREEIATLQVSWTNVSFDWVGSRTLVVNYTDSEGSLITGATQLDVYVNGTLYSLTPSGSSYLIIFNNSFDLGHHLVTLNVSRYGYTFAEYTGITFNITETVTTLTVDWWPTTLELQYTGSFNLTVDYTYSMGDVPETATVNVTIGGHFYSLTYSGTVWSVLIPGSDLDLGTFTAYIMADLHGFQYQTNTTANINVITATPNVSPNWVTFDLYYTHNIDLNLTITDIYGHSIDTLLVNVSYQGTNYTAKYIGYGIYRLRFNGSDGLGSYPLKVYTFGYAIHNVTIDLTLNIVNTPTSVSFENKIFAFNGSVINVLYYDGSIQIRALIQDVDGAYIGTMITNITIDGQIYAMTSLNNGTYVLSFDAEFLGVGPHDGQLLADIYGYRSIDHSFTIEVDPIPTIVVADTDLPSVIAINSTITITLEYYDGHTGNLLNPEDILVEWPNSVALSETEPNKFSFVFNTNLLPLGPYMFNVTFILGNYSTNQFLSIITVRAVHSSLTIIQSYQIPENETLHLEATFWDTDHDVPIHWANVVATLSGQNYNFTYIGEGKYVADIHIALEPRSYTIQVTATASNCDSKTSNLSLTVTRKYHVTIEIHLPESVREGTSVTIGATIRDANTDTPLNGVVLFFNVDVYLENGSIFESTLSATTNPEGYASQAFEIPVGATNLTVTVVFLGNSVYWSEQISSHSIRVTAGIEAILAIPEVQLFLKYGFPLLVVIGIVYAGYAKKHRPNKEKKHRGLREQYQKFEALRELRHFMAVYKNRGTCTFYYPFTDERVQPDLISGFITAVTSVYGEITGEGVQGTLEEIQYKGLLLSAYSGKYILGILILEGEMSAFLRERLKFFVNLFENQYDDVLADWTGCIDNFDAEWIVTTLHDTFGYKWLLPNKIQLDKKVKGKFAKIVNILSDQLDERGEFYFADVINRIMTTLKISKEETLDYLIKMQDTGIIYPISIHTLLTRQGLGIPGDVLDDIKLEVDTVVSDSLRDDTETSDVSPIKEKPSSKRKKRKKQDKTTDDPDENPEIVTEIPKDLPDDVSVESRPEDETEIDEAEKFIQEVEELLSREKENTDEPSD